MTKQEILDFLKEAERSDLEKMSFVYLKIIDHLSVVSEKETREREKARIKIAQSRINKWFNEYGN